MCLNTLSGCPTGTTTNKDMFKGWELPKKRPTVGIAMVGDQQHVLIPSTLTVPCHGKQIFTTVHDNQPHMSFVIYAGESRVASSNRQLGQFQLKGVPPAPFGVPQIEVGSHTALTYQLLGHWMCRGIERVSGRPVYGRIYCWRLMLQLTGMTSFQAAAAIRLPKLKRKTLGLIQLNPKLTKDYSCSFGYCACGDQSLTGFASAGHCSLGSQQHLDDRGSGSGQWQASPMEAWRRLSCG